MSLSEKGVLRWYASCCRTPLGNTPRDPKLAYVGMVTSCFDAAPDRVDAALGPRDRIVLNADSATGPVGTRYAVQVLCRRRANSRQHAGGAHSAATANAVLRADGRPIRTPEVLTAEQRGELGANQLPKR